MRRETTTAHAPYEDGSPAIRDGPNDGHELLGGPPGTGSNRRPKPLAALSASRRARRRASVPQESRPFLVHRKPRHTGERGERRQDPPPDLGPPELLELRQRARVRQGEPGDHLPAERGEMGRGAEPLAEVAGERPDVGSGTRLAPDFGVPTPKSEKVEALDPDRNRRQLRRLAGPRQPVGASPADPLGRVRRRALEDDAEESAERRPYIGLGGNGSRGADRVPRPVVGVGRLTEPDHGPVALRSRRHEAHEPGRPTHAHRKQPGCERVQRAHVTDARAAEQSADPSHDPEGSDPLGLVHEENAAVHWPSPSS